jgi:hypothetical protein
VSDPSTAAPQTRTDAVALVVISAAVLALEVFLTKLLSYALHDWLLYVVLGVAMLGFGASGTLAAVRPGWRAPERLPSVLVWACVATTFSILVGFALFVRLIELAPAHELAASTFSISVLLMLPFLAGGLVITLALARAGTRPGRAYAANLFGSGLGGALPLVLLGPVPGEGFLVVCALLAAVGGWLYARAPGVPTHARRAPLVAVVVSLLAYPLAADLFPIPADPTGSAVRLGEYAEQNGISVRKVFDRWDATGRIEVLEYDDVAGAPSPYPAKFYVQDASAGSLLVQWDGRDASEVGANPHGPGTEVARNCTQTLWGQAYYRPRRHALVVGLGGGPDVQCALYNEVETVQVVEINPLSIELVQGPFADWLGHVGQDPRVTYTLIDGRSFVHTVEPGSYDLIQLTGVDTKHLLPAGALAIQENPLYTHEAFRDYLRALSPDGTLSVIRFSEMEMIRFANTAIGALRELGVSEPERHIVLLRSGPLLYGILVGRSPFDDAELAALRKHAAPPEFEGFRVFIYEVFGGRTHEPMAIVHQPGGPSLPVFERFFRESAAGDTSGFEHDYPANVVPATDERPFFFDYTRYDLPMVWEQPHLRLLAGLLMSTLVLALGLILVPLAVRSWRRGERPRGLAGGLAPLVFAAVGLGYLFVEVWLIHRFAMYLGHQTYAMSAVLGTLLVSTGVGALSGERLIPDPPRRLVVGVVAVLILLALGQGLLPGLQEATWGQSVFVRGLCTLAFLAPLGFVMGLPFPAALSWMAAHHPGAVAWCIGINAFATVVATVAATPLTLIFGYPSVLWSAAACYVLVLPVAAVLGRARGKAGAPLDAEGDTRDTDPR